MRSRALTIAVAAATLAAASVGAAQAQDVDIPICGDSGTTEPTAPGVSIDGCLDVAEHNDDLTGTGGGVPDTDLTPKAKQSDLWQQVGGALYPQDDSSDGTELVKGSATSFDVDLYEVAFRNTLLGFAGGSACAEPPSRQPDESASAFGARVSECAGPDGDAGERVPVIYRYTDTAQRGRVWEEVYRGEAPGYVGAIAYIDSDTALAVGGDGAYPRREPAYGEDVDGNPCPPDPTKPLGANCDQAGMARAWLLEDGRWEEIEDLPAEMRGFTALECHPTHKLCFGGALGQVWHWEKDRFTIRFDMNTPMALTFDQTRDHPVHANNPKLFINRVREIRIAPSERVNVFAVTDGCCAESPAMNTPRLLAYREDGFAGRVWGVHVAGWDPTEDIPDSSDNGGELAARRVSGRPARPDSFYSFWLTPNPQGGGTFSIAAIVSAGGPERDGERASVVAERDCEPPDGTQQNQAVTEALSPLGQLFGGPPPRSPFIALDAAQRAMLSTARLVASDGDASKGGRLGPVAPSATGLDKTLGANRDVSVNPGLIQLGCGDVRTDWFADWVVGELRATRVEGLGAQGLTVATHLRPDLTYQTLNTDLSATDLAGGTYEPTSEARARAFFRSLYFRTSSYSLNAVDLVGGTGVGWAVGDRGAIVRLSDGQGDASATPEPQPPRLGIRSAAALPDRSAHDGLEPPPSGPVGEVPALRARPQVRLDEPRLEPAGAPEPDRPGSEPVEDVQQIVMSRDGSEGWAIGANSLSAVGLADLMPSFFHYDGAAWSRCDPTGVEGQLAADPACAGVAGLRRFLGTRQGSALQVRSTQIVAAARVPLERDSDPGNDDEFEVVAVGSQYSERPEEAQIAAILRYRDGRWGFEDAGARAAIDGTAGNPLSVAFSAPHDGWILTDFRGAAGGRRLFHFDGERWLDCEKAADKCDPGGRLAPFAGASEGAVVESMVAAGERVYLFGSRLPQGSGGPSFPLIAYREGGAWRADPEQGGFDPCFKACAGNGGQGQIQGRVTALAVAERPDGRYEGWAVGAFAGASLPQLGERPRVALLRLEPGGRWQPFAERGAVRDYLLSNVPGQRTGPNLQVVIPEGEGPSRAFIALRSNHILSFDPEAERWSLLPAARPPGNGGAPHGGIQALAGDGEGGFWGAVKNTAFWFPLSKLSFFHYTDHPPRPVFEEVAHPLAAPGIRLTALAGGADGSVWAATSSNLLARYDRAGGWETVRIPGWDPGRVVVRSSRANALALGPDGEGLVVGERGRIAGLGPAGVRLDAAAGTLCDPKAPQPPCGTGRDLYAVAVAPDGSAIAGGEARTVLWRPAAGEFRALAKPEAPAGAAITGVSMPAPGRAYLTTDTGLVLRGEMASEGEWHWTFENLNQLGDALALDAFRNQLALRAVAVDASGHGYAVGDRGLILERTGDGQRPWRRLKTPYLDDFTAVALPAGEGEGALVGGRNGIVLTRTGDSFDLARPADYFTYSDGQLYIEITGPVLGLALLPGTQPGEAEAWVGLGGEGDLNGEGDGASEILHYASDPEDPLLNPSLRAEPLADAPPPAPGEISLAAFGKTECRFPNNKSGCFERGATTLDYELLERRIVEEVGALSARPGGPDLTLFTGDAVDSATLPGTPVIDEASSSVSSAGGSGGVFSNGPRKLRRWREAVADPLADRMPFFGAIGSQDLSDVCVTNGGDGCFANLRGQAKLGDNIAWREAMADRAAPWGAGEPPEAGELSFEPLSDGGVSVRHTDIALDPDEEGPLPEARVPSGGASTHYAVDMIRDEEPVARLVVLDNSFRSLAASDPAQQPLEANGGQTAWLERMICFQGQTTATGEQCTREPDQQAIVLANTPTYSYGPGALVETASDMAALETLLLRYRVNVVVSGRLGWNGRYWATAPGLHCPAPGGEYLEDAEAPAPGARGCEAQGVPGGLDPARSAGELTGGAAGNASGLLPFVVASGGGGKFGPDGRADGSASEGYWHGYTIVRLHASGDPSKTIVEQRPVLDWVHLDAPEHVLEARQRISLRGAGREPIAIDYLSGNPEARLDDIRSPAITHRYDLLLADPEEPWLPCEAGDAACQSLHERLGGSRSFDSAGASGTGSAQDDSGGASGAANLSSRAEASRSDAAAEGSGALAAAQAGGGACDPYLCLPERVATVDDQTGEVQAGNGKYPDTFALAMLSVGDHVATWPLVFKKSPSFVIEPLRLAAPAPGPPPSVPNAPNAPSPPPVPKPNVPQPTLPELPALPGIPPLSAAQPPEPQPPAPPAPPPPAGQPSPLDLTVSPTAITVATPAAVIQPPTPPVNPAPPSGARREARQRQAATQKSGADSAEGGSEGVSDAVDTASGPRQAEGAQMTRRDTHADRHAFTAIARAEQLSAWSQGALYGGGIALMALALSLGWSRGRPTPRSRPPEIPAPALARARRRGG